MPSAERRAKDKRAKREKQAARLQIGMSGQWPVGATRFLVFGHNSHNGLQWAQWATMGIMGTQWA
jgi:hypothetical protein